MCAVHLYGVHTPCTRHLLSLTSYTFSIIVFLVSDPLFSVLDKSEDGDDNKFYCTVSTHTELDSALSG